MRASYARCPGSRGEARHGAKVLLALATVCLAATELLGGGIAAVKFRTSTKPGAAPVSSATVIGGVVVTGVVTATGLGSGGTLKVNLYSNNTGAASVPASVTVKADITGSGSKDFTITTSAVNSSTIVTITAGQGSGAKTAQLTVEPLQLSSLSLSASSVTGSRNATGTVSLNGNAPSATSINLQSASARVHIPASVSIQQGQRGATFEITTDAVASSTSVNITASRGSVQKTATLTLKPPAIDSVNLTTILGDPPEVVGGSGNQDLGTVTVDVTPPGNPPATSGFSIPLSSSNSSVAPVGESIGFVAGDKKSMNFGVRNPPFVASETPVTITLGQGSGARTINLKVVPVRVRAIDLGNGLGGGGSRTLVGGGNFNIGVLLNGNAPAGGLTVALTCSDPSVVPPSSITVPAGERSKHNISVNTLNVRERKTVTLTGSPGTNVLAGSIVLEPLTIDEFTLRSASDNSGTNLSALGGLPVTGIITLDSSVQGGGLVLPLSSSDPAATVPASITIPAGSTGGVTQGSFTINTLTVDTDVPVTITAGAGAMATTALLTVKALAVDQLLVFSDNVAGGSQTGARVTLNGPAPAGGLTVPLSSSDTQLATVPSNVTVLQGHTDVTFNLSTSPVGAAASVTITAGQGAGAKSDSFTVEPLSVSSVTVNPASVTGGTATTAEIMLSAAAPTGGLSVPVSSSIQAAVVPATVTVAAGSRSATFQITTSVVAADTTGTITAGEGSRARSATIVVRH